MENFETELESPRSMLEFQMWVTLRALQQFLDDPESFANDEVTEEQILNGLLFRVDELVAEGHIKYAEEFEAFVNAPKDNL